MRLIAVAVLIGVLASCAAGTEKVPSGHGLEDCQSAPATCNSGERKPGGQITWVIEQGWGNKWNPMRPEGGSYYLRQALAGTTPSIGDFLPTGEWEWNLDLLAAQPRLVKSDPQTIEFVLRPEAVWSDGDPIEADDFRYNWFHNSGRADQCEGCDPAVTAGWSDVASIESTGRTVTITYRAGVHDPEWFARFGPSPHPAHIAAKAGIDWRTPKGMGAASAYFRDTVPTWSGGPYLIDSVVTDQRVILVPNPRWYGKEKPTLTRIVKEVVINQADWPAAVANGELDGGAPLSYNPDVAQRLRSTSGMTSALGSVGATFERLDLNLKSPALADLALRRAIFTALDLKDLRSRLFGDLTPAYRTNPLFPTSSPYHKDVLTGTGYGAGDLPAARKLLADAGYSGAAAGQHLAKDGRAVPELRFAYLAGHPTRGTFAEVAQQRLGDIGVPVRLVAVPGPDYATALRGGAFDLTIWGNNQGPLFAQAASSSYRTGSALNFAGLSDPALDRAAEAVFQETDIAAAAAHANEVAMRVIANASTLPLWENPTFAFVRDTFVNVRDDPFSGQRAMYNIGSWGVSANRGTG